MTERPRRAVGTLKHIHALADFEPAARRFLPRSVFGFVAGGTETETATRNNLVSFGDWAFRTRILVDIGRRNAGTTLLGRHLAAPFGIAPMGGACMVRPRTDLLMAEAAEASAIPFMLSGVSTVRLEQIRERAPNSWFQAYFPSGRDSIGPLLDRVDAAGYPVLTVTVDVAVPANRENNLRNGWSMPLRLGPRIVADALAHPRWLLGTGLPNYFLTVPHFENVEAARGAPMFGAGPATGRSTALTWADLDMLRRRWPRKLVLKGVLSAEDARQARSAGVDGIVVSNHGGRQLDHAASPLRMLPEIKAASGEMAVMLDGGVRRGTDVLKALALGASCVFIGRPFLFAAAVAGRAGLDHAIRLLKDEIDRGLALLGCPEAGALHPGFLAPARGT